MLLFMVPPALEGDRSWQFVVVLLWGRVLCLFFQEAARPDGAQTRQL